MHLWLVLVFLYVPIVVMAVLSFNASPLYALPFDFDLVWYRELAGNAKLIDAGIHSIGIAIVNTIIATALGTMAALAFARYQFRGKTLLQLLLFPPVAIPWLVIGTAMLVFFYWIDIKRGLFAILLGHVALSLPYVIVVVGARLATFPRTVEEAAATLGRDAVADLPPRDRAAAGAGRHGRRRCSPSQSRSTSSSSPISWRRRASPPCRWRSMAPSARASRRRSTPFRPSSSWCPWVLCC